MSIRYVGNGLDGQPALLADSAVRQEYDCDFCGKMIYGYPRRIRLQTPDPIPGSSSGWATEVMYDLHPDCLDPFVAGFPPGGTEHGKLANG